MSKHQLLEPAARASAMQSLTAFCQQFPQVTFPAHTTVIEAGRLPEVLYFVVAGCVKMSSTSSLGNSLTLHLFYPGSCFSLLSLVADENRFDFDTLTETTVHKVPFDRLLTFLDQQPEVLKLINYKLLKGTEGLLHRLEQSVFVSAYFQVAGIIHYFARHFGQPLEDNQLHLRVKLTHKDISEWLGLSRENVSLQMKQLERDGVIARRGQAIIVVNQNELNQLASPQDLLL